MNKEKVSTQDIVDLVATRLSVTKRVAEDFLKALFATIEESLLEGESVKVKKLGTFKLQWNAPRKSVNVQTGEEFVISGYYKVSFNPETSLKDIVNKPFEHLEPIELDGDNEPVVEKADDVVPSVDENYDPLRIFTEQASEIKDLLSEINALSNLNNKESKNDVVEYNDTSLDEDKLDVEYDDFIAGIEIEEEDVEGDGELDVDVIEDNSDEAIDEEFVEDEWEGISRIVVTNIEDAENLTVEDAVVINENIDKQVVVADDIVDVPIVPEHAERVGLATVVEHILPLETIIVHAEQAKLANEEEPIEEESLQKELVLEDDKFKVDLKNEHESSASELIEAAVEAEVDVLTEDKKTDDDVSTSVEDPFTKHAKRKNKKANGCLIVIVIFFLLIGAFVVNYYLSSATRCWIKYDLLSEKNKSKLDDVTAKISLWFDSFNSTETKDTLVVEHVDVIPLKVEQDSVSAVDTLTKTDTVDSLQILFDSPRVFVDYIGTEKIREGSSLTRVSERFYGHKDFWVYIYEANKNLIKNPDQVPYGIVVKIPKLDARLIDAKNPRCLQKAKELHDLYVGKK